MKIQLATEHQEQSAYFDWVRQKRNTDERYNYIFAIPNGAYLGGGNEVVRFSVAKRMKKEGLEPGVPDIMIAYPSIPYYGAFLETKRKVKSSKPTKDQTIWLNRLESAGYFATVCRGFDELKAVTEDYFDCVKSLEGGRDEI